MPTLPVVIALCSLCLLGCLPDVDVEPASALGAAVSPPSTPEPGPGPALGTSPPAGAFEINDLADLSLLDVHPNGYFVLAADLDFSSLPDPHPRFGVQAPFGGTLDGRGHAISGYRGAGAPGIGDVALIARTDGAAITDLALCAFAVRGAGTMGALVGTATATRFERITVGATLTNDNGPVGGLAGTLMQSKVRDCHADVEIVAHWGAGGLVGRATASHISDSTARGRVHGQNDGAGGIAAFLDGTVLERTAAHATVTGLGQGHVGGLAGYVTGGLVRDSYVTGSVAGVPPTGGLIGNLVANQARVERTYSAAIVEGNGLFGALQLAEVHDVFFAGRADFALVGYWFESVLDRAYWDVGRSGVTFCCPRRERGAIGSCEGVNAGDSDPTYFLRPTSPPLDSFDFQTVWHMHRDGLPTLRGAQSSP